MKALRGTLIILALLGFTIQSIAEDSYGERIGKLMSDLTTVLIASKECGLTVTQTAVPLAEELNQAPENLREVISRKVQRDQLDIIKNVGIKAYCAGALILYGPNGSSIPGLLLSN